MDTINELDGRFIPTLNGGAGSGFFGHAGRKGKVGGSSKGTGGATSKSSSSRDSYLDKDEFTVKDTIKQQTATDYGLKTTYGGVGPRQYETSREAIRNLEGARDCKKAGSTRETEVRQSSDSRWDVVYRKTDVGVNDSANFGSEREATAYSQGWNEYTDSNITRMVEKSKRWKDADAAEKEAIKLFQEGKLGESTYSSAIRYADEQKTLARKAIEKKFKK